MTLIGALALLLAASPASAAPSFDYFIGNWSCEGYFIKSKKPLASDLEFRVDPQTGQLTKRHTDRAPNSYKASESWAVESDGKGYRATIVNPGGMRWYTASGWEGDRLAWKRIGEGEPAEEFVYTRKDRATMVFEWWISRDGAPLALGDTLTCTKRG
jgi:hypothetical protein